MTKVRIPVFTPCPSPRSHLSPHPLGLDWDIKQLSNKANKQTYGWNDFWNYPDGVRCTAKIVNKNCITSEWFAQRVEWFASLAATLYEPRHEKTCLRSLRRDSNGPAQLMRLARFLKFRLQQVEVLYYPDWTTKVLIRLHRWHKHVFSWRGSYNKRVIAHMA